MGLEEPGAIYKLELDGLGIVLYVLEKSASVDGVFSGVGEIFGVGEVFGLGLYSCAG